MLRILDLYCGAGGAGMGYHQAGFEVVGVDIMPQPRYPFSFIQMDALAYAAGRIDATVDFGQAYGFDAVHASPPCQAHSKAQIIQSRDHPDLIAETRDLLVATGLPYVIENVPGSPLLNPVVLEGQMFPGMRTHRPRWFETNWPLDVPFMRSPRPAPNVKMGRPLKGEEWIQVVGHYSNREAAETAMGIDWMIRAELAEAVPPAYTKLIGEQLATMLVLR